MTDRCFLPHGFVVSMGRMSLRFRNSLWWVAIALAVLPGALAADGVGVRTPQRYRTSRWTSEQGLPQNSCRSLAQTPDGYLWIGTLFGLARFDGVRFAVFDAGNTPELSNDAINVLAVDQRDGGLWIGTGSGLLYHSGGRFTRYGIEHRIEPVWRMIAAARGGVWISSRHGQISLVRDSRVQTWEFAVDRPESEVLWLFETSEAEMIVCTASRVGRVFLGESGDARFEELRGHSFVRGIASDGQGGVWVVTDSGVEAWREGRWKSLWKPLAGHTFSPQGLIALENLGLWFKNPREGLLHLDPAGGPPTNEKMPELQETESINTALQDREGNLWIGTEAGLLRLTPHRVQVVSKANGLISDSVMSVSESADGSLWMGTGSGVSRLFRSEVKTILPPLNHFWYGVSDVLALGDGRVWIGAYKRYVWNQGQVLFLGEPGPGGLKNASALYEDSHARLWVAGDRRVECHEAHATNVFTLRDGLPPFSVNAVLEARDGTMWFGSYGGGLCRLDHGFFRSFTTTHGLFNNRVWAIHEDVQGVLWLGTQSGLNRFEQGRFFRFTTEHGLHENVVNHVLEDEFGYLWFGGLKGIYRVARGELNDVAAGRAERVRCVVLGEADGMLSSETNGERTPSACRTRDGRLCFPTMRGLVIVDPKAIELHERETPLPPVVLESVSADGEFLRLDSLATDSPRPGAEAFTLGAGRARVLEIRYTANCFTAPERVRFRHRLERVGETSPWVQAEDRRVAYFTNLKPGGYRFQVVASDHHGRWNDQGVSFAFKLDPHFYETWPFYLAVLGVAVVLAGMVTTYRLRWQRRLLTAQHEQSLSEERTRIARDLHDDLGTALTGVALELDVARRQATQGNASRLSESAARVRVLASRMREVVWAVNPRCDTVSSLASFLEQQASQFLHQANLRVLFEFPEDIPATPLDANSRHQLALSVREALTNVVRHARATEAVIALTIDPRRLVVEITDNGCGFEPAKVEGAGQGLQNLGERLRSVGGRFEYSSEMGIGTTVRFVLPLRGESGRAG